MKIELINYFSDMIFKFYKILVMSDTLVCRKIIEDMDKRLEARKPIEVIKDDISQLKSDMIHIKNYIRKLEVREQLKEEKEKSEEEEYVKPDKTGWLW